MKTVIVGNGVAGITTAKYLRENSPEMEIEIYSRENYPYYPRPALIDLLANKLKLEEIYFYPPDWYEKNRIKVNPGVIIKSIKPATRTILTGQNQTVPYDHLVLAVGADAFIPDFPGNQLAGVFSLRSLDDVLAIKKYLEHAERREIVVIGGGVLGLEVAAALGNQVNSVTVIETGKYLLPRQLDNTGAKILTEWLKRKNVIVLTEKNVKEILGKARVEKIKFSDGSDKKTDLVIISTGIRSSLLLARASGLKTNKGIVVNEYLQTSEPTIFAAGDAAEFNGIVYGIIPAAQDQARIVASNIIQPESKKYSGTVVSNSLKITGLSLTSFGKFQEDKNDKVFQRLLPEKNIYKKLVVSATGQILGGIWLGDRQNLLNVLNFTQNQKTIGDDVVEKILAG